jgi:hypothetical protein
MGGISQDLNLKGIRSNKPVSNEESKELLVRENPTKLK